MTVRFSFVIFGFGLRTVFVFFFFFFLAECVILLFDILPLRAFGVDSFQTFPLSLSLLSCRFVFFL